ncbi:LuxR C-terminal-related transcriptional regulator [Microbacterium sp. Root61]|uniref:LuxR C-terminal-related transcriptional regulator n=1 Tax=Microbacterium sp. Root61 TaxID=1736570 RepID=UPI00070037FE|nr:LuxR C-terminal-related transcriptional regulator [Microbacterium sp. Root61]
MSNGQYVPVHAVSRPRLLRELDRALTRPVTLVVAQAGSGKSVLLTQWVRTLSIPAVWLDIAPADNDAEYFARHVMRKFRASTPAATRHSGALGFTGPVLGPQLLDGFLGLLRDTGPCVVVVDDLHHIRDFTILDSLQDLLRRLPRGAHVVLSSRLDPPMAWGRDRLEDRVDELRTQDLALNYEESAALVEAVSGVTLTEESVAALVDRAEGWAAGIQLAAMTLRHHPDPAAFVRQFSGSHRLVADYLSDQVVSSFSEESRNLLFAMAALDRMSSDLVAHVCKAPGARTALAELEQASMFLVPLDGNQEWFRFHHLFRDLLRFQARARDPHVEVRVLRRAAKWHLRRGDWAPAVHYLLRAEEWDRAIEIILARGAEVFERGELAQVIAVITSIPPTVRDPNLDLSILLGIVSEVMGDAVRAEDDLRRVAAANDATIGQRVAAEAFLAALVQWHSNPESSLAWAEQTLASLDANEDVVTPDILRLTDKHSLRTVATLSGGRAHFLAGDFDRARTWLEAALATRGAAYSLWRIGALGSLALLEGWVGRSGRARDLAVEALEVARAVSAEDHPSTAEAHLALALAALEHGEQESAAEAIETGWGRAEANARVGLSWVFYAASLALVPPLTDRRPPSGRPPPVAAERISALQRRGVHGHDWVSVHVEEMPGTSAQTCRVNPSARLEIAYDRLTDRELEILAYLPTRMTSSELAARWHVSTNTIKTHIGHIYQKLGVSSRSSAVTRATELGLLRW